MPRRASARRRTHTGVVAPVPVYYFSSVSNLTGRFAEHLAERTGRPVFNLADSAVRRGETDGPWMLLTPSYKAGNADEVTLLKAVEGRREI